MPTVGFSSIVLNPNNEIGVHDTLILMCELEKVLAPDKLKGILSVELCTMHVT